MKINEIPFDQKIVAGFSVIRHFVYWLGLVRTSSKITTELFGSCGLLPHGSGVSDSRISPRELCRNICDREHAVFTPLWRSHFFRIEPSSMDFGSVHIFSIPRCLRPRHLLSKFHRSRLLEIMERKQKLRIGALRECQESTCQDMLALEDVISEIHREQVYT